MARKDKKKVKRGGTKGRGNNPNPNNPDPNLTGTQVAVGQLTANLKDAEATLERLNKQLAQAPKLIEEGRITLQDQTDLYKEINRAEAQRVSTQQSLIALLQDENKAFEKLDAKQKELVKDAEQLVDAEGKKLSRSEAILKVLSEQDLAFRAQLRGINAIEQETAKVAGNLGLQRDFQNSTLKAIMDSVKAQENSAGAVESLTSLTKVAEQSIKSFINPSEVVYKFITSWVSTTIDFNKELYSANMNLNKMTGQSAKFRDNLVEASRTAGIFGGSSEDVGNAIGSMVENFSYFGTLTENQRGSILRMTNTLRGLGIESDTLANNLLYMNRNMNLSVEDSIELNESLARYAESIGMAPRKFLSEFATTMPKLEVYGNRGEEVFRQLAKQSQMAGIGIDELIGITSKMDTFEGAAQAASQLNSALGGGYFDATELLLSDPAERLDIIKKTINAQGIQFDQLGPFHKRLLATAAGVEDVAKFERILNGEAEKFAEQQKPLNDLLADSVDIMGSLKSIFLKIVPDIHAVIKPLKAFLHEIATSEESFDKFFAGASLSLSALTAWPMAIVTIFQDYKDGFMKFVKAIKNSQIFDMLGFISDWFKTVNTNVVKTLGSMVSSVGKPFGRLVGVLKAMGTALKPFLGAAKVFMSIGKTIVSKLLLPLNIVLSIFEGISTIMNNIEAGGTGIVNVIKSIAFGIFSAVADFFGVNAITDYFFGFKLFNPGSVDNSSADNSSAENVPAYRNGTSYHPGGMAIVGDGPSSRKGELVSLPQGSRVASAPRTAGLMTNQEGLMRELINKVDNLGNSGTQTINLVVDGKVLASTVFKNSSYASIG